MTKKRVLLVAALLLLVLGYVGYSLLMVNRAQKKDRLRLSGHIEATETDLAFKVSGKIKVINFDEGDWVKIGQVIAELEAEDLRDEVRQAEAKLAQAQANLAKMTAGYRPQEIREAQAQVAKAQADLVDKKIDFHRFDNLHKRKVVAGITRDKSEADYLMAQATLKAARERYDLMKEGFRKEDIEAARAEAKQAQALLDLARTRLGYAAIVSPVNGVVLVKPGEVGEVAAIGANILTVGLLDDVWFEGYIPETEQAKVKYGQKAAITTDSYQGKEYPAWVSYISDKAEFTPKTVETYKERVTLVYRTKIRANRNPNYELKPGMPAEAVIFLNDK